MFKRADYNNVANSFLPGYVKAKKMGMDEKWAVKYGDEVAMYTQFLYTKLARSMFEETAAGRFLTPFTSWPRNFFELMAKWGTGRQSEVVKQWAKATGNAIPKVEATNREALLRYMALLAAAYGVERSTNLKATEYTGWTSVRSLGQFVGGELPSLQIIGGLAKIAVGAASAPAGDTQMLKEGWNEVRPDRMIGIVRQLSNIAEGKQDWLTLFLYLKKEGETEENMMKGRAPSPTRGSRRPRR